MSGYGRYCCKSPFASLIRKFLGRRRVFHVRMWGVRRHKADYDVQQRRYRAVVRTTSDAADRGADPVSRHASRESENQNEWLPISNDILTRCGQHEDINVVCIRV